MQVQNTKKFIDKNANDFHSSIYSNLAMTIRPDVNKLCKYLFIDAVPIDLKHSNAFQLVKHTTIFAEKLSDLLPNK